MKKVIVCILALFFTLCLFGCDKNDLPDSSTERPDSSTMSELEKWVCEEWTEITEFKVLYVKILYMQSDTKDTLEHKPNSILLKASYTVTGEEQVKEFTFNIRTYAECMTLYNSNNDYVVYNIETENGALVTDITQGAFDVIKTAIQQSWEGLEID